MSSSHPQGVKKGFIKAERYNNSSYNAFRVRFNVFAMLDQFSTGLEILDLLPPVFARFANFNFTHCGINKYHIMQDHYTYIRGAKYKMLQ